MKKLLILLACVLAAPICHAQTVTITGSKVASAPGVLMGSGQWCIGSSCFSVTNGAIAPGSSISAPTTNTVTVTSGGVTYLTVPSVTVSGTIWTWDSFVVPYNATITGIGVPYVACAPGAIYEQTDASDLSWTCFKINNVGTWELTSSGGGNPGVQAFPVIDLALSRRLLLNGLAGSAGQVPVSGGPSGQTVWGAGSGAAYNQTVQNAGRPLTQRQVLNFTGSGVSCADDPSNARTDCTITGGGGGAGLTSFNGRTTAAAVPTTGDYTAAMVTHAADLTASNTFSGTSNAFQAVTATTVNGLALAQYPSVENISIGSSLPSGASGSGNFAMGASALGALTNGDSNYALGAGSLQALTTGSFNVAVGVGALAGVTTGSNNVASADAAQSLTTGNANLALGFTALYSDVAGSNNVALGLGAGYNSSTSLTTLNNSVYLGVGANSSTNGVTNQLVLGYGAHGSASNQTIIGNSSVTQAIIFGVPQFPSLSGSGTACVRLDSGGNQSRVACGTSGGVIPTPPSNAAFYPNLQIDGGSNPGTWLLCSGSTCAGGTDTGSAAQAFGISSPSLSGASQSVTSNGNGYNVLAYRKMAGQSTPTGGTSTTGTLTLTVGTPTTTANSISISASASDTTYSVTSIQIYVDGVSTPVFDSSVTPPITPISYTVGSLAPGYHLVVVKAWDTNGTQTSVNVPVSFGPVISNITNALYDTWFWIPSASNQIVALEFDPDLYDGNYEYFLSVQCDSASGDWREWDMKNVQWITPTTPRPCGILTQTNVWHHIQLYGTFDQSNETYTYQDLVVDGATVFQNANETYSAGKLTATPSFIAQHQIDNTSSATSNTVYYDDTNVWTWGPGSGGGSPGGSAGAIQYYLTPTSFGGLNGTGLVQANGSGAPTIVAAPTTLAATTHEWIDSYNATTGTFHASRPTAADVTNAADLGAASNTFNGDLYASSLNDLSLNQDANGNIAIGGAVHSGSTGAGNVLVGTSLVNLTSGSSNFGFGLASLAELTSGGINVALGPDALPALTTGSDNIASAYALQSLTTGSSNIALGVHAGNNLDAESNVIAIGGGAGGTHAASSNSEYLGVGAANLSSTVVTNQLVIGYGATSSFSNQTVIGNSSTTNAAIFGTPSFTVGSSITSASTIAPSGFVSHVTGSAAITTITAPSGCTAAGLACQIQLIPDAGSTWTLATGGNIAAGVTPTTSQTITLAYDPATSLWYPPSPLLPQSGSAGPQSYVFNDFFNAAGVAAGGIGSPTGSSCAASATYQDQNHPGNLLAISGTGGAGTGETCEFSGSATLASLNGSLGWLMESAVDVPVLPGTTAGSYQFGADPASVSPWTSGVGFYLSSTNGVANDWYCRYGTTQIDSTVAATTSWTRLTVSSDGTNVHWLINGTAVCGTVAASSLPAGSMYAGLWSSVAQTSTSVAMAIDYFTFERSVTR